MLKLWWLHSESQQRETHLCKVEKSLRKHKEKGGKELERERRVRRCGWRELSSHTAHLKASAMLAVTPGSRRQVGCLCQESRSLDSSERWQAELTQMSDYMATGLCPITCCSKCHRGGGKKKKKKKTLGRPTIFKWLHLASSLCIQIFFSRIRSLKCVRGQIHVGSLLKRHTTDSAAHFIHLELTISNECLI